MATRARQEYEDTLQPGTRIYYTGDMANLDGFGTITARTLSRWADMVDITMDDERTFRGVPVVGFSNHYSGNCSTRFVTEAAYHQWRAERIALLRF